MIAGRALDLARRFVNRGDRPASCPEIGDRMPGTGPVHYADVDLALRADTEGRPAYTHKDGTPY